MLFYASKLSNNISKTPEGYLICCNVPVARTGVQKYLGQELGLNDKYDEYIPVYRLEEDVFDKSAMASFEGKSITDNHPYEPVDVNNNAMVDKGHIQNIRRVGDELVGDLIIKDPNLISVVENNVKREISCGYNCKYEPYRDGYRQIDIRGNHVAIVDKGRAGSHVCIKDSLPERRTTMSKKTKILASMLKSYAKDASPEELAEAAELIGSKDECTMEVQKDEEAGILTKIKDMFAKSEAKDAEEKPAEEEAKDAEEAPAAPSLEERLAKLEEALARLTAVEKEEGHEGLDEEPKVDEMDEQILDADAEEKTEDAEEEKSTQDSLVSALKPVIAKIKDASDRKMVTDALKSSIRGNAAKGKNGYDTIIKAMTKSAAKMTHDSERKNYDNLGKEIAAKYNPHYKKEN